MVELEAKNDDLEEDNSVLKAENDELKVSAKGTGAAGHYGVGGCPRQGHWGRRPHRVRQEGEGGGGEGVRTDRKPCGFHCGAPVPSTQYVKVLIEKAALQTELKEEKTPLLRRVVELEAKNDDIEEDNGVLKAENDDLKVKLDSPLQGGQSASGKASGKASA